MVKRFWAALVAILVMGTGAACKRSIDNQEAVRQAIGATEIADLGDREPKIVEAATEPVDEVPRAPFRLELANRARGIVVFGKGLNCVHAHSPLSRGTWPASEQGL